MYLFTFVCAGSLLLRGGLSLVVVSRDVAGQKLGLFYPPKLNEKTI